MRFADGLADNASHIVFPVISASHIRHFPIIGLATTLLNTPTLLPLRHCRHALRWSPRPASDSHAMPLPHKQAVLSRGQIRRHAAAASLLLYIMPFHIFIYERAIAMTDTLLAIAEKPLFRCMNIVIFSPSPYWLH
jgi:hypothetical protein